MAEKNIFREKSLERIKSPENLNEYIKVANPGMWLCLFAVLTLLLGFIVWGSVAQIDSVVETAVIVKDNKASCYFPESKESKGNSLLSVNIEDKEYAIGQRSAQTVFLDPTEEEDAYILHLLNDNDEEWCIVYDLGDINLEDGIYKGTCVVDSVRPISFFTNEGM